MAQQPAAGPQRVRRAVGAADARLGGGVRGAGDLAGDDREEVFLLGLDVVDQQVPLPGEEVGERPGVAPRFGGEAVRGLVAVGLEHVERRVVVDEADDVAHGGRRVGHRVQDHGPQDLVLAAVVAAYDGVVAVDVRGDGRGPRGRHRVRGRGEAVEEPGEALDVGEGRPVRQPDTGQVGAGRGAVRGCRGGGVVFAVHGTTVPVRGLRPVNVR